MWHNSGCIFPFLIIKNKRTNLRFWHSSQRRFSSFQVSLWLVARWWQGEYAWIWLSKTWSRASKAFSWTELSESATAGTTPWSHAFCIKQHSGLAWLWQLAGTQKHHKTQDNGCNVFYALHSWLSGQLLNRYCGLTFSISPTHCNAFFFTDTAGSRQRSESRERFVQLMGITPCFRRPTRAWRRERELEFNDPYK